MKKQKKTKKQVEKEIAEFLKKHKETPQQARDRAGVAAYK